MFGGKAEAELQKRKENRGLLGDVIIDEDMCRVGSQSAQHRSCPEQTSIATLGADMLLHDCGRPGKVWVIVASQSPPRVRKAFPVPMERKAESLEAHSSAPYKESSIPARSAVSMRWRRNSSFAYSNACERHSIIEG